MTMEGFVGVGTAYSLDAGGLGSAADSHIGELGGLRSHWGDWEKNLGVFPGLAGPEACTAG